MPALTLVHALYAGGRHIYRQETGEPVSAAASGASCGFCHGHLAALSGSMAYAGGSDGLWFEARLSDSFHACVLVASAAKLPLALTVRHLSS